MSMNATFVQVDTGELLRLEADPSSAELLFHEGTAAIGAFMNLSKKIEDRVRAASPQALADAMSRISPGIQELLAQRLGKTPEEMAAGLSGDEILNMMQQRRERVAAQTSPVVADHDILKLDKEWHGVHYLLSGSAEPGPTLLSQAVMGGTALGADDEGFSGYGPARYFTAAQVGEIAAAMSSPQFESQAAARFDPEKMTELEIYPGWESSEDAEWVMDAFRRVRDFYSDAANKGRAIVTCLV